MRCFSWVVVVLLTGSLWAQPKPVATVESIAGDGRLLYQDAGKPSWFRAFVDMENYLGQHLKTDAGSMATLRFKLGGLANLSRGSEIEIVGERDVQSVGNTLLLKSGSLWAKVDKQKKELQIKTAGGVMAIKGTEFVVQVQENGDTKLSLLEGSVVVQPDLGESYQAEPGSEVIFGRGRPLVAQLRSTRELLQKLRQDLGDNFFEMRQNLQQTRQQMLDLRGDLVNSGQAMRASGEATRESILNSLSQAGLRSRSKGTQRRPEGGQVTFDAQGLPTFSYADQGASQYALFLSRGDSFRENLAWAVRSSQNRVTYPADGRPLEPGFYRWRVVPLDASGQPMGTAVEGSFTRP
jgi:hypothetical protein